MEDMAAVLNQVAGGLQQSFGTIFERVGESLEQSAQLMQMMNAMMEAALLQNLQVTYEVRGSTQVEGGYRTPFALHITVENNSQIRLAEVLVRLRSGRASVDDSTVPEQPLEGGLDANSAASFSLLLPSGVIGQSGTLELAVRSPGTQQWLQKDVVLRIPVFKLGRVTPVPTAMQNLDGFVFSASDIVSTTLLRDTLGVNAFDPLLTATVGHYIVHLPGGVVTSCETEFIIVIKQTRESTSGVRVVVATPPGDNEAESKQHCQSLVQELESL